MADLRQLFVNKEPAEQLAKREDGPTRRNKVERVKAWKAIGKLYFTKEAADQASNRTRGASKPEYVDAWLTTVHDIRDHARDYALDLAKDSNRRARLHRALDRVLDAAKAKDEVDPARYAPEIKARRDKLRSMSTSELRNLAQQSSRLDYAGFKNVDKQSLIWHILSNSYGDKTLEAVYNYLNQTK